MFIHASYCRLRRPTEQKKFIFNLAFSRTYSLTDPVYTAYCLCVAVQGETSLASEASVPGFCPAGGQHVGTAEGRPREPDGERLGGFVSGGVSCPLGLGVGMVPRFGRAMLLSLICYLGI